MLIVDDVMWMWMWMWIWMWMWSSGYVFFLLMSFDCAFARTSMLLIVYSMLIVDDVMWMWLGSSGYVLFFGWCWWKFGVCDLVIGLENTKQRLSTNNRIERVELMKSYIILFYKLVHSNIVQYVRCIVQVQYYIFYYIV